MPGPKVYFGCWTSDSDMRERFRDWGRDGVRQSHAQVDTDLEGAQVLLAGYRADSCEGSWTVLYEKHGKYFAEEGSHCSCGGPTWSPREVEMPDWLKREARYSSYLREDDEGYTQRIADLLETGQE